MGTGSDVAKDASDLVLSDDNFASILAAVEEGRRMFANIQKFVLQLLAGNVMQALLLLVGLAFKDVNDLSVFPLAPVEILWVIMVSSPLFLFLFSIQSDADFLLHQISSSFPAMGLGAMRAEPDVLKRPPHNVKMGPFTIEILWDMLAYGLIGAGSCLGCKSRAQIILYTSESRRLILFLRYFQASLLSFSVSVMATSVVSLLFSRIL